MASELIDLSSNFQLPLVAAQVGTCIAAVNTSVQPLSFTVHNTSASSRSFTLYRVPVGGSATASNAFITDRTIAPKATYVVVEAIAQALPAGFSIWGSSDAAAELSVSASGARYTNE